MKVCLKCSAEYEPYGQRRNLCRCCRREYDRDYYKSRPKESKQKSQEIKSIRSRLARKYLLDYLSSNPCVICGEADPVVLEFDHLDQSTKEYAVSTMVTLSIEKIEKEISKCRVLCANCHRRHTAIQLNWYSELM